MIQDEDETSGAKLARVFGLIFMILMLGSLFDRNPKREKMQHAIPRSRFPDYYLDENYVEFIRIPMNGTLPKSQIRQQFSGEFFGENKDALRSLSIRQSSIGFHVTQFSASPVGAAEVKFVDVSVGQQNEDFDVQVFGLNRWSPDNAPTLCQNMGLLSQDEGSVLPDTCWVVMREDVDSSQCKDLPGCDFKGSKCMEISLVTGVPQAAVEEKEAQVWHVCVKEGNDTPLAINEKANRIFLIDSQTQDNHKQFCVRPYVFEDLGTHTTGPCISLRSECSGVLWSLYDRDAQTLVVVCRTPKDNLLALVHEAREENPLTVTERYAVSLSRFSEGWIIPSESSGGSIILMDSSPYRDNCLQRLNLETGVMDCIVRSSHFASLKVAMKQPPLEEEAAVFSP